MKTASSIEKHLRDLEGVNPGADLILHFQDGSTRSFKIHKKSVLPLFCASMNLFHFVSCPEEYTAEARQKQAERKDVARDPAHREDAATGRPISRFDFLLELFGRAERISGDAAKHLVAETWSQCRMRAETLRRGKRFYYTRENTDPFFENCTVGPYAPDSASAPDVPAAQSTEIA
ncbi:MAG: hypothetical protein ABSG77_13875 [Candidatus Acidiferrum sp.]|jgi:hypothetical protein